MKTLVVTFLALNTTEFETLFSKQTDHPTKRTEEIIS